MSMSDCEKCWDTPCSCGHGGYVVVYLPDNHGLSYHEVQALVKSLEADLPERIAQIKEK